MVSDFQGKYLTKQLPAAQEEKNYSTKVSNAKSKFAYSIIKK